jgi:dolichol-phosphate mannosyltransferase
MMARLLLTALTLCQIVLGARVALRLVRSAGGRPLPLAPDAPAGDERLVVIVPVLNEVARLGPCLDGLIAQHDEVEQILVVDGGSTDGTQALVRAYAGRTSRLRLIEAGPAPPGWNGKVWGLQVGLEQAGAAAWVLTIDADVRPAPALARSLLAQARRTGLDVLSLATLQEIETAGEAFVHPALLATLIYRFGIPGRVSQRVSEVQANGQCCLIRRSLLAQVGGFAAVRDSVCEDVTLARALAAAGHPVGFFEAGALARCRMYTSGWETWRNWTRSLPLRDRYAGIAGLIGLAEVTLVQALPVPWLLVVRWSGGERWSTAVNLALAMMRLGILAGAARAYCRRPWSYWLSPLCDLPAALQLWRTAFRRQHSWRGRILVRGG